MANVGRSTFYAHFNSKDDLKGSGLEHLRRHLVARQSEALAATDADNGRRFSFSLTMFDHARDHAAVYRALLGDHGGSVALGFMREILTDLVRAELGPISGVKPQHRQQLDLVVQYVVGAFMSVMTWWLDNSGVLAPN